MPNFENITYTYIDESQTVKKTNAGKEEAGVAVQEVWFVNYLIPKDLHAITSRLPCDLPNLLQIVNIQETEVADKDEVKVSTTTTTAVISRAYDFTAAISHLKKADPKLGEMMDTASTSKLRERILRNGPLNPFR